MIGGSKIVRLFSPFSKLQKRQTMLKCLYFYGESFHSRQKLEWIWKGIDVRDFLLYFMKLHLTEERSNLQRQPLWTAD